MSQITNQPISSHNLQYHQLHYNKRPVVIWSRSFKLMLFILKAHSDELRLTHAAAVEGCAVQKIKKFYFFALHSSAAPARIKRSSCEWLLNCIRSNRVEVCCGLDDPSWRAGASPWRATRRLRPSHGPSTGCPSPGTGKRQPESGSKGSFTLCGKPDVSPVIVGCICAEGFKFSISPVDCDSAATCD